MPGSLEIYFKLWLGFSQLQGVGKVWLELFWKLNKKSHGRFLDLRAWRWRFFSSGGFSTSLQTSMNYWCSSGKEQDGSAIEIRADVTFKPAEYYWELFSSVAQRYLFRVPPNATKCHPSSTLQTPSSNWSSSQISTEILADLCPRLLSSAGRLKIHQNWKSRQLHARKTKNLPKRFFLNFQNSSTHALATPSNWKILSQGLKYFSRDPGNRRYNFVVSFCWIQQSSRILDIKIEKYEIWKFTFLIPMLRLVVADVSGESRDVLERFYDDLG